MGLGTPELLIVAAIVILFVGTSRIPKLARSLGEAKRELRAAERDDEGT